MAGSRTALAKLGIGSSATVNQPLDFIDFDPGIRLEIRDMNGTRGKLSKDGARTRQNRTVVNPRYRGEPTVTEWTYLLPWIMGGTPTGTGTVAYPLADANPAPQKYVWFAPESSDQFEMSGVAVDDATFRAVSGEPLGCELGLVGMALVSSPGSYPALSLDVTTQPFILSDLSLSWQSSVIPCREFSVSVRNNIDRSRYLNSLTLTTTQKLSRQIVASIDVPHGDTPGIWNSGIAGGTLVGTFTNPSSSAVMIFSLVDVRFVPVSPQYPFAGEGFTRLEGEAYMSAGGTQSLVISLNPGS